MARSRVPRESASWKVSKSYVAGASFVIALVALTGLVIVVSVKDVDTLSTVALVLAVLAFIVQILVFVVQAYTANAQMLQAQALHGQMTTTLGQIKQRAEGTQNVVDTINDQLLSAALGKARAETGPTDIASPEFAARIREIVGDAEEATSRRGDAVDLDEYPPARPDPSVFAMLSSWPPLDDAAEVMKVFEGLGEAPRGTLGSYASDELVAHAPSSMLGPGLFVPEPSPSLIQAGLIAEADPPRTRGDRRLYQLTDLGRRVGRLMTAAGDPPDYLQAAYRDLIEPARSLMVAGRGGD
jgi:hypothetical protein